MSGRHQPLNGADAYVPARSVRHDSVQPSCVGCAAGKPCSQACSACGCRWSGDPISQPEECPATSCACHDEGALECTNCSSISSDIRRFDFGRAGIWEVCGVCADRMEERADAA